MTLCIKTGGKRFMLGTSLHVNGQDVRRIKAYKPTIFINGVTSPD
jgi:hypothetical protein